MLDLFVLGGGPAGITAAIYAARSGCAVTLMYKDGGALVHAERIENYYGFSEPVSGQALLANGLSQARRLGVLVQEAEVVGLSLGPQGLLAETSAGPVEAEAVVLATGLNRRRPQIQNFGAFDGAGVSYCAVCDGFFCRGRDVAVLGAGAYALHEAAVLLPLARSVTLLTNGAPAPAELPPALNVDSRRVEALLGDQTLQAVTLEGGVSLPAERLFVALGTADSGDLARKVGALTENGKVLVDEAMATNVPGLFAAGDCTGGLLQIAKAIHQGAQAGLSAVRYLRKQEKARPGLEQAAGAPL